MSDSITTIITRRRNFDGFWITTNSIKSNYDGKWSNCLYLHFAKEDFKNLELPKLVESDSPFLKSYKFRFNYDETILNKLPFHGGITFYEEMHHKELDKTFVKVGCDYQHLWDDGYRLADCGPEILRFDGESLASAFIKLTEKASEA